MDSILNRFKHLTLRARWGLSVGLLLIVGLSALLLWWSWRPTYAVLFSRLRQADAGQIIKTLDHWHVPYKFSKNGSAILVPSSQVYGTRMKLAAKGVPTGGIVGFELFNNNDYGVTQFAQRVNYKRALQGELERTIDSMTEIKSSRVHLTIHHSGLFDKESNSSKGSVTVALRQGRRMTPGEINGVQRLVASAVEGLKPNGVVVLDQNGTILSTGSHSAGDAIALAERIRTERQIETHMTHRVERLLAKALPMHRFSVSVEVRMNFDRIKEISDKLLPQGKNGNGLVVRETSVPAPTKLSGQASGTAQSNHSRQDVEVVYAHGNEKREVDIAPGRIEKISVAVVIPAQLSRIEIRKLSAVVSAGLGLETARGDRVEIAAFSPAIPASAQPVISESTPKLPIKRPTIVMPQSTKAHRVVRRSGILLAYPWVTYVTTGLGVFVLLGGFILLLGKRTTRRRLEHSEREIALTRIRRWIEASENMQ